MYIPEFNFSDRYVFIGATGSGKTTAVKKLLTEFGKASRIPSEKTSKWLGTLPIHILDTKRIGDFDGFIKVGSLYQGNKLPPLHNPMKDGMFQVYQPEDAEDLELINSYLGQIFEAGKGDLKGRNRRPALIYIDEIADISKGRNAVPYYRKIQQIGRGLQIGIVTSAQSPSNIDSQTLRQVFHLFKMRTNSPYDQKKLGDIGGAEMLNEIEDDHGLFYRDCTKPVKKYPPRYFKDFNELFS